MTFSASVVSSRFYLKRRAASFTSALAISGALTSAGRMAFGPMDRRPAAYFALGERPLPL
jgi:hypothetical protein